VRSVQRRPAQARVDQDNDDDGREQHLDADPDRDTSRATSRSDDARILRGRKRDVS
jgi:hypothetical protein